MDNNATTDIAPSIKDRTKKLSAVDLEFRDNSHLGAISAMYDPSESPSD